MVTKSNPDFLLIVGDLRRDRPAARNSDVSDYLVVQPPGPDRRALPGVGDVNVFGVAVRHAHLARSATAGRLQRSMPGDVIAAIQAQNTQVAAGQIGGLPRRPSQMLNATVTAQSRLHDARAVRATSSLKTQPTARASG